MADPSSPPAVNPFAKFGDVGPSPQASPDPAPVANDNAPANPDPATAPEAGVNPFAKFGEVGPDPTSATGAFVRGAMKGALPAAGSLAAAGMGAEVGGAFGIPLAPFTAGWSVPVLGAVGGIVGGIAGGKAVEGLQNWGLSKVSPEWRDALGFGEKQAEQDQKQHDIASFGGGLFPYIVTMHPSLEFGGGASKLLPEGATLLQRILARPAMGKFFGGGLVGGMEASNEYLSDQKIQWPKVAIATVFGTVFSKPNGIGEAITELGARPTRAVTEPVLDAMSRASPSIAYARAQLGHGVPTLAQAADLKVMGPGITESVFHGTQEQAPQAAQTAQENARVEQTALGEPPEPDLNAVARQMEPETFARYDELLKRRDLFGQHEIEGQIIPPVDAHLARTNAEIEAMGPEIAAAYRRARDTVGTGEVAAEPFPTLAHMLAAHENGTGVSRETNLPEMQAPAVAEIGDTTPPPQQGYVRFYHGWKGTNEPTSGGGRWTTTDPVYARDFRRSEDEPNHVSYVDIPKGDATEVAARRWDEIDEKAGTNAVGSYRHIEIPEEWAKQMKPYREIAAPVETPATATPVSHTIGEQRAFIANDVSQRLIAAGRPAEEAEVAGHLIAARYVTRAGRFEGKLGSPEQLYAREGAAIAGPGGRPQAPAGAQPEPVQPSGPRGRAAANPQTWSLYEFLAHEGGLKPTADLKSIFGNDRGPFVPGFGPLLRPDGLSMDEALTRAKEQRYVIDRAEIEGGNLTVRAHDLQDMVGEESRGKKHYILGNEPIPEGKVNAEEERTAILDALHREIREATGAKQHVDPEIEDRVVEIIQKEGVHDVHEAFERAIMEDHDRHEALLDERRKATGEIAGHDHPGRGSAPGIGEEPAVEGRQERPSAQETSRANGEPSRDHGEADRETELAQHELGPDGKPQTIIPGTERITDAELAQRRANEALKPKAAQRPMDTGLFGDTMDQKELFQVSQGGIRLNPRNEPGRDYLGVSGVNPVLKLFKQANASTIIHESGHQFLAELMRDAAHPDVPEALKADAKTALDWLGVKNPEDIATRHHEKFARGFEQYLREGVAPSPELAGVFAKFRNWLLSIYQSIKGLGTEISPDIRHVFDRLLEMEPQRTIIAPERPPGGPLLHEIHAADALHTEPHEAEAVADRTKAERERALTEPPPEIAREVAPAVQKIEAEQAASAAARGGAEPGGEAGAGPGGPSEVVPGSGGPVTEPGGGGVGAGRGDLGGGGSQPAAEGADVQRPDNRAKLGDHPGTALAPGPADLFGAADSGLIDKAGNIVLKNLNSPEEVLQAFRESAGRNNNFIGNRRGKVTPGQVSDLARDIGMEGAEDIVNSWVIGRALNAEQIEAVRLLARRSATSVHAAWSKAAASGAIEDILAQAEAEQRHDMIQGVLSGATAEWGRAGGALRMLRADAGGMTGAQIVQRATGKTLFQAMQRAKLGAELKTPQQAAKLMNDAKKYNFSRIILEYWINGLISGPATHLTYMAGNTISAIMKIPEAYASAAAGHIASQLGREGTGVHAGEAGALITGAARGFAPAVKAGIEALRTGVTTALPGEGPNQAALPFQPHSELAQPAHLDEAATFHDAMASAYGLVQGMKDTVISHAALVAAGGVQGESLIGREFVPGRATPNVTLRGVTVFPAGALATLPGRGVAVIHSFYRALIFSMEKNAMAYRQATNEGLTGTARDARMAQLRTDPSQTAMNEAAAHEATEAALMGKGSELTQRLSALTNTPIFGSPLLKFIDPFVRVSGNIIDQSLIRRTPVGLLTLFGPETELARDLTGKNGNVAQDKAIGRMMVGTALAVTFGSLAAQKMLSGSGPSDPKEAHIWMMAGNQPHSIRIGDTWYQVNKLGPVGMLASISADLYDVAHEAEQGEFSQAGAHLLHAITQNVLDESAMHGPAELLKAIETPDRYGESYIRNYLTAFVPYSVGFGQIARAMDPYQRDTKTLIDAIRNKIPGHLDSYFGNELPVRRDIWGEPLPSRQALGGAGVSAIYETQINNDPVNQAMWKLGVFPGAVMRKIRNAELTPEQYDDYQRIAGRSAKMRLDQVVISPQFQRRTPSEQHDWMVEVIRQSRSMATETMLHKYPVIAAEATQAKKLKRQTINERNVE